MKTTKGCRNIFAFALTLLVLTCRPAFAKNLDQIITYEQFETLMKTKTGQLAELSKLWEWQKEYSGWRQVYLSGGTMRGLAHWIHENLQNHSYEEVMTMPVPAIEKLLRVEWSDRDLVAPDKQVKILQYNGFGDWDILPESFQTASTKAGGPGIDKSRVNPYEIVDPLGGLKDYYHGQLTFHPPTGSVSNSKLVDNTQTALALRYLREGKDLPELELAPSSMVYLKSTTKSEKLPADNYWINKALHKLYISTGEDVAATMIALRNANLLAPLSRKGFKIKVVQSHALSIEREVNAAASAKKLVEAGFTFDELIQAEGVAGFTTIQAYVDFTQPILPKVKTVDEFQKVARPVISNSSEELKVAIAHSIEAALADPAASGLFAVAPDLHTLMALRDSVPWTQGWFSVITRALERVHSSDSYLALIRHNLKNPSNLFKEGLTKFIQESADGFLNLKPVVSQMNEAAAALSTIEAVIAFKRKAALRLTKAGDLLKLLNFSRANPSDGYRAAMKGIRSELVPNFFELKPSSREIAEFLKLPMTHEGYANFRSGMGSMTQTPEQLLGVLKSFKSEGVRGNAAGYVKVVVRLRDHFLNFQPSVDQIHQYMRLVARESLSDANAFLIPLVKRLEGLEPSSRQLLSLANEIYVAGYPELSENLLSRHTDDFARLGLSPADLEYLVKTEKPVLSIKAIQGVLYSSPLFEAKIASAIESREFLPLLQEVHGWVGDQAGVMDDFASHLMKLSNASASEIYQVAGKSYLSGPGKAQLKNLAIQNGYRPNCLAVTLDLLRRLVD